MSKKYLNEMEQIPKKCKKEEYYYHVSESNLGKTYVFEPREWGDNRSPNEPTLARVCVAPSVPHCLSALPMDEYLYPSKEAPQKRKYIYRTAKKVMAHKPFNVSDSSITKEKWLLEPVEFEMIGVVTLKFLRSMPDNGIMDFKMAQQRKFLSFIQEKMNPDGTLK